MAPATLIGEIRPVTITEIGTNSLFGTLKGGHVQGRVRAAAGA